MAIVYANIGSNLGNRRQLIEKALDCIYKNFGINCISGFVESEPWGFVSANRFLNIGVAFRTELYPEQVLDILQEIEKEISHVAHRDSMGNYKDREIDIDIMAIDNIRLDSERLTLPHRYLFDRPFFLIPFNELRNSGIIPSNVTRIQPGRIESDSL